MRRKSDNLSFLLLPGAARAYVAAVVAAGAGCLVAAALQLHFDHAVLFAILLGLAIATSAASAIAMRVPAGRSDAASWLGTRNRTRPELTSGAST